MLDVQRVRLTYSPFVNPKNIGNVSIFGMKIIYGTSPCVSLWACQLTAKQQHTKSAANQASRNLFTRSQAQPSLDHEDPPLNHCARVNMHVYIKFWNHHDANLLHGMQFTPVKGGKRSETYSGRQSESLKWFSCCHRSGSETSLRGAFW